MKMEGKLYCFWGELWSVLWPLIAFLFVCFLFVFNKGGGGEGAEKEEENLGGRR